MPSDESKGSQLDAIGSLAQRQLDNTFLRRTPVANTDTKLLIYGLFQKGRVLAQDGISVRPFFFLARLQVGFRCFAQAFVERHELRF